MSRLKWVSVAGLVVLASAVGALAAAVSIDRSDRVMVGGKSDRREAAARGTPVEHQVDSRPPGIREGAVDTDRGREVLAQLYSYLEGLEGRAGEPRITPDRAGVEVPIVGLSEEEAVEVSELSTGEITVTATWARLSASELATIARRVAEHVEGTSAHVRLDTVLEQVVLVSPEPLSDRERSEARSLVDSVLGELMTARLPDGGGPDSMSGVTPDDVLIFEAGLASVG